MKISASKLCTLKTLVILLLAGVFASAFAQEAEPQIFKPEKKESQVELVDSTKNNSVILNVNIFGNLDVGSYYILWDEVDLSEDMKKLMTTRDFARDEFFMQNIDREQFEQERMLQLFEDRKREFYTIFPEEAMKALREEQDENGDTSGTLQTK